MYYNYEVTYKYMPFNLQAALGYAQFQRLDELVNKKREIWQMYNANFDWDVARPPKEIFDR